MKLKNKRGNMLTENVVFIILNVVFLTVLVLFLVLKMGDTAPLEERYAKQIALTIDASRPGMSLALNFGEDIDKREEGMDPEEVLNIQDNIVTVRFSKDGGYSYSFFNNVNVEDYKIYPNGAIDINVK
ncbi:MAG: hypothetical protein ABIH59_00540 [archaeon]